MYRLFKQYHLLPKQTFNLSTKNGMNVQNLFNIYKKGFFKKTNYLLKKDYYSKKIQN